MMAGFVFDFPGIEAVLKDWEELRQDLDEDWKIAGPMVEVVAPGHEPASWGVERHAARAGAAFFWHNFEMRRVVNRYIDALTTSRNAYLNADEAGRDMLTRDEEL
jgi:hypothetical protein